MNCLGIELGNLKICGVYEDHHQLYTLTFGNDGPLFSACSYTQAGGWRYGTDCMRDLFLPESFVYTHSLQFYPMEYTNENATMVMNDSPLVLCDRDGRIAYGTKRNNRFTAKTDDIISALARRIYDSYCAATKNGNSDVEAVVVLPSVFFVMRDAPIQPLMNIVASSGFRRVSAVSEPNAVIRVLCEERALYPSGNYLIVCCGEIYNDYCVTKQLAIVNDYPTPTASGRNLEYDIVHYILEEKLPKEQRDYYNALSDDERMVFHRECVFSVRASLFDYLRNFGILTISLRLKDAFQVPVPETELNRLCFDYARALASHAYSRIGKSLPSTYRLVLCGDFGLMKEVKEAFKEQFKIRDADIRVKRPSTFAEGALMYCKDAREERPNIYGVFPVCSTC